MSHIWFTRPVRAVRTRLMDLIGPALRRMVQDDGGVTAEQVIWIAFLTTLALTVGGVFGPQILAAARSVTFK